jgi:hypothetical protein
MNHLKHLSLFLVLLLLPGCTLLESYLTPKFDSNEYAAITEIRHLAGEGKSQCATSDQAKLTARKLESRTRYYQLYSEQIPRNYNGLKAAAALDSMAAGLVAHYNGNKIPSTEFCKLKFEGIEMAAANIQHTIGNRPR